MDNRNERLELALATLDSIGKMSTILIGGLKHLQHELEQGRARSAEIGIDTLGLTATTILVTASLGLARTGKRKLADILRDWGAPDEVIEDENTRFIDEALAKMPDLFDASMASRGLINPTPQEEAWPFS